MATSGVATQTFEVRELIEEAFERAGTTMRGGYDLRSARRSLSFMMLEWANRGLNLWSIEEGTVSLTSGTATYNLPADTIDLIEHWIRTGSGEATADYTLYRMSPFDYAEQVNKLSQGQPTNIMVMRTITPTISVWPVPDTDYTLKYYRLRRIQDVGDYTNTMDVPWRFIPALVAGLAFHIASKRPELAERVQPLMMYYEKVWTEAADEDRDRASLYITPYVEN